MQVNFLEIERGFLHLVYWLASFALRRCRFAGFNDTGVALSRVNATIYFESDGG